MSLFNIEVSPEDKAEAAATMDTVREELILRFQRVDRFYIDSVISAAFLFVMLNEEIQHMAMINLCKNFAQALNVPEKHFALDIKTALDVLRAQSEKKS